MYKQLNSLLEQSKQTTMMNYICIIYFIFVSLIVSKTFYKYYGKYLEPKDVFRINYLVCDFSIVFLFVVIFVTIRHLLPCSFFQWMNLLFRGCSNIRYECKNHSCCRVPDFE